MNTEKDQKVITTFFTASFTGKTSHAAAAPDLGRSAFDALQMTIWGIEMLRKHSLDGILIKYKITSSGNMPCNIVADKAEGIISIRTDSERKMEWTRKRIEEIVAGAAMATETKSRLVLS